MSLSGAGAEIRRAPMILTGTCSWSEKTLLRSGQFYPPPADTPEKRLRHYSSVFSTVEVDSTYYAVPSPAAAALWTSRTPDDFIFHVKAYGALTAHAVPRGSLPRGACPGSAGERIYVREPETLERIAMVFKDFLGGFGGKLGLVIFQFPPWFRFGEKNLEYIGFCRRLFGRFRLGIEFRHGSWLSARNFKRVSSFLSENNLAYVTADEPQFGSFATVPFIPFATAPTAYFRFHGRNRDTWLKRGAGTSERYKYLYSEEELRRFMEAALETARRASTVFLMFNNCHGGFAVKNALRMKELARAYGGEEPGMIR